MKINKNALISIIIVILFLGSTLAAGLLYYNPNNQEQQPPEENNQPVKQYYTEVDANISEVFLNYVIFAKTNVYDETQIENVLREIDGVTTAKVSFINQEDEIVCAINLSYKQEKKEEVYLSLTTQDMFEEIDVYKNALFEVPKNLLFTNYDTNETKEYYLPSKKIEGFISYETQEQENISAIVFAQFQGDVLVSILGQEQEAQQTFVFGQKEYPIESWENQISLTAEAKITTVVDTNEISGLFESIEITTFVVDNLTVVPDENIFDRQEEITSMLDEDYVENVVVDENVFVYFAEDVQPEEYLQTKDNLLNALEGYEVVSEPKKEIKIIFNQEDIDVQEVTNRLEEKEIETKSLQKLANVLLNDLNFDEKTYTYEEETTQAWVVYPDDVNQETLLFDVQALVTRSKINFLVLSRVEE